MRMARSSPCTALSAINPRPTIPDNGKTKPGNAGGQRGVDQGHRHGAATTARSPAMMIAMRSRQRSKNR
jgi:hypothetical protein